MRSGPRVSTGKSGDEDAYGGDLRNNPNAIYVRQIKEEVS